MKDYKTQKDVIDLTWLALGKGLYFEFHSSKKRPFILVGNGVFVVLYDDMSPTDTWYEIARALKVNGFNIYERNFEELQMMVENFKSRITK
jgi:hypothetical protein